MFNKLRLQLTLTNVVVVSIICITLVLGIFFAVHKIVNDQTDQLVNLISSNAGLNSTTVQPKHKQHIENQYRYFYVKTNQAGDIIETSPGLNIKDKNYVSLISKVLAMPRGNGKIEFDGEGYRFIKGSLENPSGTSIIFIDTHPQDEILGELLGALVLASISGLVLAFFGSLFMTNRALIPIKESWKRQKDFVADASHELRTPLTVIETTLDILFSRRHQSIESQIKWLENIQTENKRMTKLVSDLLLLARADSEQGILEKKIFSLHSALIEAYIPFESIALQKGISLEPFEGPSVEFCGDELRIKQLVVILIDNALKHTPSGGNVRMILRDIGSSIEIVVSDTGEGIEKEHIDKIFQRFYRVDKARSRKEGSVGLGLSIAQWIIKEHNGSVKVDSDKGTGTTFSIILPKTKSSQ